MRLKLLTILDWPHLVVLSTIILLTSYDVVAQDSTRKISQNSPAKDVQLHDGELQKIKGEIQDLQKENKEFREDLDKIKPFENWAWVLMCFGVGSVAVWAWLILKYVPRKVKEQAEEKIAKLLTDRRDDFLSLLKDYDLEKVMKSKHQIVLMSHPTCEDNYHYEMLQKNGFQVKALTNVNQLNNAVFNENDVLVINNDGGHWEPGEVENFVMGCSNYCFYFGNGRINLDNERLNRFAAANFRTQFIGNLVNILKYSHH
ncbi:NARF domain-containing protein [Dyadobacter sp. CY347]|uniref:NARF domain-containing protein n=1 Tax=Dyadobacter sp. CY347 TaxID=2909336 RepID=UPI001F244AD8|nr:NARF domain-containing protein [Dyadobacter sp. CY347]MCF2489132.1 hypothetical protein [Dyadobacter sp. CY347]